MRGTTPPISSTLSPGPAAPPAEAEATLIDALLAEQRCLTAVGQFARAHDREEIGASRYRHLLPLSAPGAGEQYAFEVDLDQCSGCKACVAACHSLNGLDEGETWREVGALVGEVIQPAGGPGDGNRVVPLQQFVTTACHHCVEPACLLGCPVLAYDKDPATGIVRHLDDQCIGCSYCILKCPYDAPKYSKQRGIVRKCDLCHGRLATGEAPACVQACPNEAITITLVKSERGSRNAEVGIRKSKPGTRNPEPGTQPAALETPPWLPDSPNPSYTLPTTRYVSSRGGASLRAADHANPRPQPAHWPLVLMLVLTQCGMGGLVASLWAASSRGRVADCAVLGATSLGIFVAGLVASVFHLGRPAKAWRVWLGWRTSWLSREAIALNLFLAFGLVAGFRLWRNGTLSVAWSLSAGILGLVAVASQSMVYADTRRESWRLPFTGPRFFGSPAVLGLGLALIFRPTSAVAAALLVATLVKIAFELRLLQHADTRAEDWTPLRRTAALQAGIFRPVLGLRLILGLAGGVGLPFFLAAKGNSTAVAIIAFTVCLLGEVAERWLFFTSVAPAKMPGAQ